MKLKIKKLHPAAIIPKFATEGAACFDLHALAVDGDFHIGSNVWATDPVLCETGLAFEVPPGHAMLIFSRSGHGFNDDVRLANCVGVIDSDYRGEVKVKLTCDRDVEYTTSPFHIKPGDRIAQAMIIELPHIQIEEVEELSDTARGTGGFGSTGQ